MNNLPLNPCLSKLYISLCKWVMTWLLGYIPEKSEVFFSKGILDLLRISSQMSFRKNRCVICVINVLRVAMAKPLL